MILWREMDYWVRRVAADIRIYLFNCGYLLLLKIDRNVPRRKLFHFSMINLFIFFLISQYIFMKFSIYDFSLLNYLIHIIQIIVVILLHFLQHSSSKKSENRKRCHEQKFRSKDIRISNYKA